MALETPDPPSDAVLVGTDVVEMKDIRRSIEGFGARYLARVYTARELSDCVRLGVEPVPHLAARFAAKEAAMKVLRPSKDEAIPFRDIESVRTPGGWCELSLSGAARAAARRAGLTTFALSLSHETEYATAVVVGQRSASPDVAFATLQHEGPKEAASDP